MRDYAKLSPAFWIRGSGKRLRGLPEAQVVAAYLSTSPGANMIGIYYVPIDTIAHDTGLGVEAVQDALVRIEAAGYAKYDHDAELAWVPNHAKMEIGATMSPGDKRRPKVIAELAHVSDHPFAGEFVARYADAFGLPKGLACPIEGASGQADGASADLEQDRTGQDRTDQGRTGSGAPQLTLAATDEPGSGSGKRTRGTRLPDGWTPSESTQTWARKKGIQDPLGPLEDFRLYWQALSGAKAVKLDWDKTYQQRLNFLLENGRIGPNARGRPGAGNKQPLGQAAGAEWMRPEGGEL